MSRQHVPACTIPTHACTSLSLAHAGPSLQFQRVVALRRYEMEYRGGTTRHRLHETADHRSLRQYIRGCWQPLGKQRLLGLVGLGMRPQELEAAHTRADRTVAVDRRRNLIELKIRAKTSTHGSDTSASSKTVIR